MRILITGAGGFVGKYLVRHLLEVTPDAEIHGTALEHQFHVSDSATTIHTGLDLRNARQVRRLLAAVRPDHIYHLAAQSSPARSRQRGWAWKTLENNIKSQLNLIESCLSLRMTPRILVISSGDIYGNIHSGGVRIHEDTPMRPRSPYAVSKAAQDLLGLQYFLSDRLPIIRARPFNHTGPGQSRGFVVPDYASRIAAIECHQQAPVLTVYNPSAQRDFSDVRDIVRAYRLLMERGIPGEAYNIASGRTYSVQALVDLLLTYADIPIRVIYDESGGRSELKNTAFWVDTTRIFQVTGWQPEIPFEQTLLDVLNDSRQQIRASGQSQ